MITLNISTSKKHSKNEILEIFTNNNVECQIIETISSIKGSPKYKSEKGYSIKIFDLDKNDFKIKIWEPLVFLLDLKCAFIIVENQYMGCIRNWPGVFTQTNCQNQNCCN